MKRLIIFAAALACAGLGFSTNSLVWQRSGRGIYESRIRVVIVDPMDQQRVYAGTSKALYRSNDNGRNYEMILKPSGASADIHDVFIPPDDAEIVYAATGAGLYESLNGGRTWERIFFASDDEARRCLSVARYGGTIAVGTKQGLFYRRLRETQWHQLKQGMAGQPVMHIAQDGRHLYLATRQDVYRLEKKTRELRKIFSPGVGREDDSAGDDEAAVHGEDDGAVRSLVSTEDWPGGVLLATRQGIYFSADSGGHWASLPAQHLALEDLTALLVLKGRKDCRNAPERCMELAAGTRKGVFFLDDGRWKPVYKGMETNDINGLGIDKRGTLYAATDKGMFLLKFKETLPSLRADDIEQDPTGPQPRPDPGTLPDFAGEPDISEVHKMAIDYAEVHPDKIRDWRRQARRRAWLPDLDVGVDSSRDWSSSDTIYGSYSNGGQHYIGPDDKTRGEDIGWDVSLSWDLADLIWSTDQTTIDSRSKMMVELREDVLNEVTRLYFERRRNQIELAVDGTTDWRLKLEQEMRVAEMTALIDALTGGEFSKELIERRNVNR